MVMFGYRNIIQQQRQMDVNGVEKWLVELYTYSESRLAMIIKWFIQLYMVDTAATQNMVVTVYVWSVEGLNKSMNRLVDYENR